jgi:hypothetical protein
MTTAWFFAPPSAWTRFPCAEAVRWMYSAMGVDPTKLTAATPGCWISASTATLSPFTRLSTPGGSPASWASSTMRTAADGFFSEGLSTNVLPHATAIGNIHIGTIAGKLKGVIPAHTPTGCRSV